MITVKELKEMVREEMDVALSSYFRDLFQYGV